MASRCITTLNDLDKISDKIYHKHSKRRFRAGIEAKLKAAKEKAERSSRETSEESTCSDRSSIRTASTATSTRCFSTSVSTYSGPGSVRSTVASTQGKKTGNTRESKPATYTSTSAGKVQRERIPRRKTMSCPSCSVDNTTKEKSKNSDSDTTCIPPSVSMFGKYSGVESQHGPSSWFNLPQGTNKGVIDSYACSAKGEKPLCYSVNVKKGKSVPHLLKHNLEVRVGQNGVVNLERNGETLVSEAGYDCDEDQRVVVKQGKKRTAPLSWEEQLNWRNTQVISSEPSSSEISSPKSLCETHPVIFNDKKSEQEMDSTRTKSKQTAAAYKISLETRWVYPDRRNLVSTSDRYLTAVELEDSREEEGEIEEKSMLRDHGGGDANEINEMNVKNVERSYPTFVPRRSMSAEGRTMAGNQVESSKDKITKKVSFEDEVGMRGKVDPRRKPEPVSMVSPTEDNGNLRQIPNDRQKTSRDTSDIDLSSDEAVLAARKLSRPHTAPPASRVHGQDTKLIRLVKCVPVIKIPTSRRDVDSPTDETGLNSEEARDSNTEVYTPEESEKVSEEEDFSGDISVEISPGSTCTPSAEDLLNPRKRSSLNAPKSAPVSRTSSRHVHVEEAKNPPRAKSTTALHRKMYTPPPPVVVVSEASLELPKDLPPAQALIALRKKIREDLAQQNRELQLDIQQLYLNKHSECHE